MSSPEIKLIQQGLRGLDHDPGPVDGVFGPRTRAAGEAWLSAGGRRPTPKGAVLGTTGLTIWQGKARYAVREVIVHCSATRPSWMANAPLRDQVAEIRRWHVRDNGWRDIGYHWIVAQDGSVMAGRPETEIGAHVIERNQGTIGICLIGGHGSSSSDPFRRNFSPAQDMSLRQLLAGIAGRTRIDRVSGHNEYAAKACPGFNVPNWMKEAA